jgi:hypothetical protein
MKLFFGWFIICSLLTNTLCIGQINYSNYKLIVLVEEPNKKIEEKLDLSELTTYQKEIETYNANLKSCIELYWKLPVKPEFMNKSQITQVLDSKTQNTIILTNTKFSFNFADYSSYKLSKKLYQNKDVVVENYSKKQLPYRTSMLELRKADLPLTAAVVASVAMPSINQDMADLIYGIKSLALQIDYKNKGTTEVQLMKMYIKNAPHLKTLTLLINQHDLDETAKTELKTHYKLPIQVVDQTVIAEAIKKADVSKAFTMVIPNVDGSFTFKVLDASNMEILGQSGTIPPSEYYPELNNKIKTNHLEDFTHYCD